METQFTYSLLKYRHSLSLGEVVNIGLLIWSSDTKQIYFRFPRQLKRLSSLYSENSITLIRRYLKAFSSKVNEIEHNQNSAVDLFQSSISLDLVVRELLPITDNSIYFEEPRSGITSNISQIVRYLENEFLKYYFDSNGQEKKDEAYIRKNIHRLINASPAKEKIKKTVKLENKSVSEVFDYSWQNGVVNYVNPLSFDLSDSSSIQNKSLKWFGSVSFLNEKDRAFAFLTTRPDRRNLLKNYKDAVNILLKTDANIRIIEEDHYADYVADIASKGK